MLVTRKTHQESRKISIQDNNRLDYIDGIRGIAAIFVVLCHLSCIFMPELYYIEKANSAFELVWLNSPLNIFTNGHIAVQCFFVLSGFLITRKVYSSRELSLESPIKIYVKLLRIVAPAVILAAIIMATGLMKHLDAMTINPQLSFVKSYNNFEPTIKSIVNDIFFRTYIETSVYIGPLWTIKYELIGSIVTYMLAYYISYFNKYQKYFYIIIASIVYFILPQSIFAFILGAFAYECVYRRKEDKSIIGRVVDLFADNIVLSGVLLVVGVYLLSCNLSRTGIYQPLSAFSIDGSTYMILGIAITLFVISTHAIPQKILGIKPLRFLGKLSPYIYAFHWPIILSLGCGLYILLADIEYNIAVLIITVIVIVSSCALAWGYMKILPYIRKYEKKAWEFLTKKLFQKKQGS